MYAPATHVLRLRDRRLLEFALYGHPGGVPAFFFHGFIGSHHQAYLAREAAERHGLWLIAPNRPGVGRSTPRPRRCIADGVGDVAELASALGVERFVVLGASGGGPYALACLARLPQRVRLAAILSGLGPVGEPGVLARMNPFARRALQAGRHLPLLVRCFFAARARLFRRDPEAFLAQIVCRWSRSDQELLARPALRQMFLSDLREVLLHGQGAEGMAQELGLYFRWGFRLSEVPPGRKVLFWHGTGDRLVPPFMACYMASRLPGAEVELRPGGHFMAIEHADEVIRRARALLDGPPLPGTAPAP
jgi:pimeloyl-ACP methyl ester carboxylesterase